MQHKCIIHFYTYNITVGLAASDMIPSTTIFIWYNFFILYKGFALLRYCLTMCQNNTIKLRFEYCADN